MPRNQKRDDGGGKPEKKLTYKQKSSIRFVDDSDPPFLRAMKDKLGYQEPKIEDKFEEQLEEDEEERDPDDILNMKESERPSVVVLDDKKDLTVEELDEEIRAKMEADDRRKIEEGRITFKKPVKRANEDDKSKDVDNIEDKRRKNEQPLKANAKMLSFGDDEEDE